MSVISSGATSLSKLPVGATAMCRWKDNEMKKAEILDSKEEDGLLTYYVHFEEFNRRLDRWIDDKDIYMETAAYKGKHIAKRSGIATPVSKSGTPGYDGSGQGIEDLERKITRNMRRKMGPFIEDELMEDKKEDSATLKEHEEVTKIKNIEEIEIGKFLMETWYFSPYPEEFSREKRLFICEFCLKYMRKKRTLERHKAKCTARYPPGDEIYRKDGISVFEVDGKKNKIYCQNLCLLAKLFLDHKTLYYDVEPFLFYIMCEVSKTGYRIVGYFSKEKHSPDNYNLACILTLPPYQKKGYGRALIQFSYELSKIECNVGSPEKPLSDLGLLSYRSYWAHEILNVLSEHKGNISIKEVSELTSITTDDVISTLQSLNLIKYWKGQHFISVSQQILTEQKRNKEKIKLLVDSSQIFWTPHENYLRNKRRKIA